MITYVHSGKDLIQHLQLVILKLTLSNFENIPIVAKIGLCRNVMHAV